MLITGGAGFIGCNLADHLAKDGLDVLVLDNLSRPGVERNWAWLRSRHGRAVSLQKADIRDAAALRHAVRDVQAVFHLAAQVAVTTSLDDPIADFEVNAAATLQLMEAVRACPRPPAVVFASTNKVYGDLQDVPVAAGPEGYQPKSPALAKGGVTEARPLSFASPYGCSKGAADQYVLDYARSFGLLAVVLRLSCVYGPRQMGGADQGWVSHCVRQALDGEPITIFGDGDQTRDLLQVRDAVAAFRAAWAQSGAVRGTALNIGGGPGNLVSLNRLLGFLEQETGSAVTRRHAPWRPGDQRWFAADATRAGALLQWRPQASWRDGVRELLEWTRTQPAKREGAAA